MDRVAVIGGGPAGLRVAQVLSERGHEVHLYEQKRSVGRKFLIAGKSGLNLTNDSERESFLSVYQGTLFPRDLWYDIYTSFDNTALRAWAERLGQSTFVSSGQKVFPKDMKAAPLLRSLVKEIKSYGGIVHVNRKLKKIVPVDEGYALSFYSPLSEEEEEGVFTSVVLALGGGSWGHTGSDGTWVSFLSTLGVKVKPLQATNCGWEVDWEEGFLNDFEGTPLKNMVCSVGDYSLKGELVITRYGIEGGPIYRLGHALRQEEKPVLEIDFKPSFSPEELARKVESVRRNILVELPQRWKVSYSVVALLRSAHPEVFLKEKVKVEDLRILISTLKRYRLPLNGPRPIEEAISSAGGVAWSEVDDNLMLKKYPNLYLCGEMLDWEAPTGGYLLQGCFSTASWVAHAIKMRSKD